MFTILIGTTTTSSDHLDKDFTQLAECVGSLRDGSSIIDPVILIEGTIPVNANYAIINEFSRKYFITDIKSIRTGLIEISLHVDVLSTYADQIRAHKAVIARNAYDYNLFLSDPEIKCYQDPNILTMHFSGSLPSEKVVLIVAGHAEPEPED